MLGLFMTASSTTSKYNRIIRERLEERGVPYVLLSQGDIVVDYSSPHPLRDRGDRPLHLDCVLQRLNTGRWLPLLDIIAALGVPVVNSPQAWRVAMNKAVQSALFATHGIPQPKTYFTYASPGHLSRCFQHQDTWVMKATNRDMGRYVYKVGSLEDVQEVKRSSPQMRQHTYLQSFVDTPGERQFHIRVNVIGGKATRAGRVTAPPGEFITNVGRGGSWEVIEGDPELFDLAEHAAAVCGMDYAGVDIMEGPDGYLVIEINDNQGLGPETVDQIIDYLLRSYPQLEG